MRPIVPSAWLRASVVVAAALAMTGCATGPRLVSTQVTTFNQWSALPAEKTFAFARTLEYQDSLEMKSYEDIVRDELAIQGFRLAADPARAELLVTLRPSLVTTQLRVRDPWYGGDPFWRGGFYGGWYGRRGGYGGWYDPFWNDWYSSYTVDVYRRRLEVDIDARAVAGKRYYEGRVESTGETGSLPAVMPYLIRALFSDFPGNNGQTKRVDVPVEPRPAVAAR